MESVEVIEGRLFYVTVPGTAGLPPVAGCVTMTPDDDFVYDHFFADFGPLSLGNLHRFCERLDPLVRAAEEAGTTVFVYSSDHGHRRANAVYLVTGYCVAVRRMSVEDTFRPFVGLYPPLIPFRDASFGLCTYTVSVLDCLRGLARAAKLGWYDFASFDVDEYKRAEQLVNGDLNWIVPGKFIAFSGPLDEPKELASGGRTLSPADYVPHFKANGVSCVVRLNKACYARKTFIDAGIRHVDLFFPDGSTPPDTVVDKFISVCEAEPGAVAVHCKAGLGRTGTCIGLYVMKHWKFTAREFIAWCRICRPGSIIGPQQHYLEFMQAKMHEAGHRVEGVTTGALLRRRLLPLKPAAARDGANSGGGRGGRV